MRAPDALSQKRIWLLPFSILAGVAVTVYALTCLVDAQGVKHPSDVVMLIVRPNPEAAANTLANAGEIVAAVLAIALTVVAIIVELASNRYTHRVTELFIGEPINFAVMALFVVTALQGMWVNITLDNGADGQGGFVPYAGIAVSMGLLTLCLLILLPYINFVFRYLNPLQIVRRIRLHTLDVIRKQGGRSDASAAKQEAVRGVEQLADVALNAMEHRDKAVSIASINALLRLMVDYQAVRPQLSPAWFELDGELGGNPDFLSMDPGTVADLTERKLWFEMKVLRQYQMVYGEALNRMRDLNYVIAINTRRLGELAVAEGRPELLALSIKFFNTYLRAAINAHDVRTAYNVFNQYRKLAETLLARDERGRLKEVMGYFKFYGGLAFNAHLPFILETVAYDMCAVIEQAFRRKSAALDDLLAIFLRVDKESEGEVQEANLRGVRKAQVKLATLFLAAGDAERTRRIQLDMEQEDRRRLSSIRDELSAVRTPEYWEVTDRGANFDYIPPERRDYLGTFFAFFGSLPEHGRMSDHNPLGVDES